MYQSNQVLQNILAYFAGLAALPTADACLSTHTRA